MTTLATNHRNKLERVITEAREVAETGAKAALEAFAVHHHEPYAHMTPDDRKLRNRLRAHGRQLGDFYDSKKGTQAIDHLVNECAYEHWHRMLFARFLAENDLLIEPEMGVAISLNDCKDLAKEQRIDQWVLASRYAQQMLPQIFRPDDPVLQVTFAREHLLKLERLLESLEPEVFTASDAIGWVYQFWQSKKKKEINESEKKIGADELPAVTQLFTEPYMVSFLIHNTLGAWYAGKVLAANPDLARNAENEEELRNALALPGVTWDYLRFIRNTPSSSTGEGRGEGDGIWQPAAGTFDGWPKKAAEIKVLDPCCGSGHFLVAVFLCLLALRMEEEGLSAKEACDAVLRDNIFGLEIDERCTQLAAFNVALSAWKIGGYQTLPSLHLACSGLAPRATEKEWIALAGDNDRLKRGMKRLYSLFKDAPVLGSLINPRALDGNLIEAESHELAPLLTTVLASNDNQKAKLENNALEIAVTAQGLAKAAEILAGQFTLVITNVPYLGRGKQDSVLTRYCDLVHPKAKADLATCFVERCLDFCVKSGSAALVTPQNWLFLKPYTNFRSLLLETKEWRFVARLGAGAFETISGEVVQAILIAIDRVTPRPQQMFFGIDAAKGQEANRKANLISTLPPVKLNQDQQRKVPDSRVIIGEIIEGKPLEDFCTCYYGICSGDSPRFLSGFWELPELSRGWLSLQDAVSTTYEFGGMERNFLWEEGNGQYYQFVCERLGASGVYSWIRGGEAWGKRGVSISRMGDLACSLYCGDLFDQNVAVIVPQSEKDLTPLWCFVSSQDFVKQVRVLDQKLSVTPRTMKQVTFDLEYWRKVAAEKYTNGLPKPHSDDPTQWLFNGHPKGADQPLHVAVSRLLGYRWPRQTGSSFPDCPALVADGLESLADDDGIVCIPSIRGEDAAVERLREMLAAAYGTDWSPTKERELVTAAQAQATDLDDWLRNSFFEQHCQLFHHRPFVWHIWDGRKRDGFHALVNYHKLAAAGGKGRQLFEKLTYGYLGDWITLQKDGVKNGVGGADDRLAAALELEKRLKAILEGEPPFDIFLRWKPIEKQPIGWEPDINDGVRLNIRPFMANDIPGGKKGAGILRWKPNIKWEKDRGKDVTSAPWFDLGPQYGGHPGDRINDHHLTCEEKRKAREAMEKTKEKQI